MDENKVRLIFTYNQANPPINMWLRDCKRQLERNDLAKAIGRRMQVAHRQPKNLQKNVGGARVGRVGATTFPPTQVVPNVDSAESCVQKWWRLMFLKVQQPRNSTL